MLDTVTPTHVHFIQISFQYCAMGLGWVGLDFRGLLPSLFEE